MPRKRHPVRLQSTPDALTNKPLECIPNISDLNRPVPKFVEHLRERIRSQSILMRKARWRDVRRHRKQAEQLIQLQINRGDDAKATSIAASKDRAVCEVLSTQLR